MANNDGSNMVALWQTKSKRPTILTTRFGNDSFLYLVWIKI